MSFDSAEIRQIVILVTDGHEIFALPGNLVEANLIEVLGRRLAITPTTKADEIFMGVKKINNG